MMRLHDNLSWGKGYKARLLLTQLGIPFERVEYDIDKGEMRSSSRRSIPTAAFRCLRSRTGSFYPSPTRSCSTSRTALRISRTSGSSGRGFCSGCSRRIPTFHRTSALKFRALLTEGTPDLELALYLTVTSSHPAHGTAGN
jgi:hypothetical protein